MDYSILDVSRMTGISSRTLRYYDEIGLLAPKYQNEAGYRYYGIRELDRLQQILFYRERGLALATIGKILDDEAFDVESALYEHLADLNRQKKRLTALIETVVKTIQAKKGACTMNDKEKFEAFKQDLVKQNETQYGEEIRKSYGDETVDASNQKMLHMSKEEYRRMQTLGEQLNTLLKDAVHAGISPESETGQEAAVLHKEWLLMTWKTYSKEAHKNLVDMYLADERFQAYYDSEVPGCAQFLRDAVHIWA